MAKMRRENGSQLAEVGPALTLLVFVILLPMINFIYLATAYGTAWYLNHITVHELSMTNPKDATAQAACQTRMTNDWSNLGLAHFIGIDAGNVSSKVTHKNLTYTPLTNPNFVALTTDVSVKPFIPVPLLDVPGLGKDIVFSFSEQQPLEEKGLD